MGKPSKNSHSGGDWRWSASYGAPDYGGPTYGDHSGNYKGNNFGKYGNYGGNNYGGKGYGGNNYSHGGKSSKGYSEEELRAANKRTAVTVVSKVKSTLRRFATTLLDGDAEEEAPCKRH
jgi:hypothetical protein